MLHGGAPSFAGHHAPLVKRVLIISPYFPPANTPDMQRVRHSLPHFRAFGWEPVTLAVDPAFVEGARDENLLATLPPDAEVHRVRALNARTTRRFGLGSLALRSLWSYLQAGNRLLSERRFDLVYFSTTQYAVVSLGPHWKRRFGVPFVVDIQDPWWNEAYQNLPAHERPRKHWFSSRLDQWLEPLAMRRAAGVVAVTQPYIDTLTTRYPNLTDANTVVIPFGVSEEDYRVASSLRATSEVFMPRPPGEVRGVYTGVVNMAMKPVLAALFEAFRGGLDTDPECFEPVRLHFVGTNYATGDSVREQVMPLAHAAGVAAYVHERTERVPYFDALAMQQDADFLLLCGTTDPTYTASKLYPYIFACRPIFAVFHSQSSVTRILDVTSAGTSVPFEAADDPTLPGRVQAALVDLLARLPFVPETDWAAFEPYTAREMTRRQAEFFEQILAAEARHGARRV